MGNNNSNNNNKVAPSNQERLNKASKQLKSLKNQVVKPGEALDEQDLQDLSNKRDVLVDTVQNRLDNVMDQVGLNNLVEKTKKLKDASGSFLTNATKINAQHAEPSSKFTLSSVVEFFKKVINFISCGMLCKDENKDKSE